MTRPWHRLVRIAVLRPAAILLGALLAAGACQIPGDRAVVEVGKHAPAYSAVALGGKRVSLDDLEGRVVLLNIWATWCAPCREEIPYLQELYEKYSRQGLEVVGVSVDAAGEDEQIKAFLAELRVSYPIWRDPEQRVMSLFLSLGVPASYLLDRNGVLRWKHLGVLRPENKEFSAALESALAEGATR